MLPPPQKKKVKMTGWKIHDEDAFHCISYWNWWFSYWNWWFSDFDVLFVFSSSQGCTVANSKAVSVHPDTEPGGGGLLAVWSMWVMWWSEGFHLEPSSARKKSMLQHVWTFFLVSKFYKLYCANLPRFHVKAFVVWRWGCPWFYSGFY